MPCPPCSRPKYITARSHSYHHGPEIKSENVRAIFSRGLGYNYPEISQVCTLAINRDMQCFDDDSDDCYINACDEAIANWNAARSQLQTFAYGSVGASTSQLVMNQGTAQHASQPLPYCPHSCCPGVFTHCGGRLSWIQLDAASSGRSDQHSGFFGCERFSSSSRCAFKYWPHPVQRYAQVSMEMEASGNSFRVVPAPGAEAAVARAGGIRTILSSWLRLPTIPPALPQGDGSLAMSYPLSEHEKVERLARDYKKNLLADNESSLIPQPTLKSYRQQSLSPSDQSMMDDEDLNTRISKMPRSLFNALLPFQREGVSFGIRKNARVLIADEMGVGKTLQGIALASCYQETWPLLIIVPAALRLMWAEELEKWLPALVRPGDIHLIEGSKTRVERSKKLPLITITSYEMAGRLTCKACKQEGGKELGEAKKAKNPPPCEGGDCLASMGFNFVLVDESHNLRTSSNVKAEDTDKAKASSIIALRAKHAVFLTGTPSLSKPHDLYRQVATLAPHIFTSKDAFEKRYCDKRIGEIWSRNSSLEPHDLTCFLKCTMKSSDSGV